MQGTSHSTVDVQSILSQIRPFMEMAFDIASKTKETSDEKFDALQVIMEQQIKNSTEQIALLRESLEVSKSNEAHHKAQLVQAQCQNLAYELISKVEKLYAKYQGESLTLKEGCYLSNAYDLTHVEKAFDITPSYDHRGVQSLVDMITDVKEQRLLCGHSPHNLKLTTKLSDLPAIVNAHFSLSANAMIYYKKAICYAIKRVRESRGISEDEFDSLDLTVFDVTNLD